MKGRGNPPGNERCPTRERPWERERDGERRANKESRVVLLLHSLTHSQKRSFVVVLMMMRPIILLLAISVSSALKSTTDRYMPDMWYTKENITDDIRRGIDWLDFENSADCVARQRVFPKISDGFKIIQTPADIQRMLVERLDICCPKEKRYEEHL